MATARAILPPQLRPGDAVRIVAPSSPFEARLVWRALGWLATRYEVRYSRGIFAQDGYLAGSDERRREELATALEEPGVRAILAARGGYGLNRVVHQIDWTALRRDPRWLVGFSDVTALHVEAARQGVASLHACHLTALGRGCDRTREQYLRALEQPTQPLRWTGLRVLQAGVGAGPVFGGNLSLLHACAAAGRLQLPPGCLCLLEDVGERPYRLDRMLTTLLVGGHLDEVSGFLLGQFEQCAPGPDGRTVSEVVCERLGGLGVPVVEGAPVGHGLVNDPVVLGRVGELEARGEGVLVFR